MAECRCCDRLSLRGWVERLWLPRTQPFILEPQKQRPWSQQLGLSSRKTRESPAAALRPDDWTHAGSVAEAGPAGDQGCERGLSKVDGRDDAACGPINR